MINAESERPRPTTLSSLSLGSRRYYVTLSLLPTTIPDLYTFRLLLLSLYLHGGATSPLGHVICPCEFKDVMPKTPMNDVHIKEATSNNDRAVMVYKVRSFGKCGYNTNDEILNTKGKERTEASSRSKSEG